MSPQAKRIIDQAVGIYLSDEEFTAIVEVLQTRVRTPSPEVVDIGDGSKVARNAEDAIDEAIKLTQGENGRPSSAEATLCMRSLQVSRFWFQEHRRQSNG